MVRIAAHLGYHGEFGYTNHDGSRRTDPAAHLLLHRKGTTISRYRTEPSIMPACAVCGGVLDNRVVRLADAGLWACRSCRGWTYLPRPSDSGQASIHDNEEYFHHPYFDARRSITPQLKRRCTNVFSRFERARGPLPFRGARLLDIGCDTGSFLAAAKELYRIEPVGVDVSARAVAAAAGRGVEAHAGRIEDQPPDLAGFPLVTAIDLLEHIPDPAGFLRAVHARTAPGGCLYLETPNTDAAVYRLGGVLSRITRGKPEALLSRLFPEQHCQYLSRPGLHRLAREAGFEVVETGTRVLPSPDIAASAAVRCAMGMLQLWDRLSGTEILHWAVLRRPVHIRQEDCA